MHAISRTQEDLDSLKQEVSESVAISLRIEPQHVISNKVAFGQVLTQTSLCSHLLSLETQNGIQSVANTFIEYPSD